MASGTRLDEGAYPLDGGVWKKLQVAFNKHYLLYPIKYLAASLWMNALSHRSPGNEPLHKVWNAYQQSCNAECLNHRSIANLAAVNWTKSITSMHGKPAA